MYMDKLRGILQEEDYITVELIDPSLSDDANFCYLFLFSGEEAIEKLSKQNPAINILIDKLELKAYRINERK